MKDQNNKGRGVFLIQLVDAHCKIFSVKSKKDLKSLNKYILHCVNSVLSTMNNFNFNNNRYKRQLDLTENAAIKTRD